MNQQGHQKRSIVLGPVYMEEGGHQIGEVTCGGSPHLSCKCDHIKVRYYIIWTGGLPQLPGVPHLHVNRPEKIINSSFPFFNNFEENNTLRWSAKDINKIKLPLSTTGGNIDLVILIRICKPQMERKHK